MQRGSLDGARAGSRGRPAGHPARHAISPQQLGVAVGDTVTLLTPQGTLSPMGMIPRTRRVRVAGIFSLGLYEFDAAYGFVSLDVAERLLGKDAPDLIELRVDRHLRRAARSPNAIGRDARRRLRQRRTGPT